MAWLALVAQAGGAAINAQGEKASANAQADQLTMQANQDNQTADATQAAGYQAARRIRTQGQTNVGAANASLAASGVDVSQGTATDIRTKITQNAEQDAMTAILNADSKATNQRLQAFYETQGAADARKAGQQALAKGALSALAGGAKSSSGWKTAAGSTSSADTSFDTPSNYG
ncbi:hypothetical protein SAMN04487926_12158 [Paraburkholderia steynii]|uniref:Uncharacterized protein n=1 Tax=Paraburkholderia steynii TaxID=1245441 RepID=A0A7Z7BBZ7_9BURK|nr:hypothetical protein [Paraburkholderia steynii]SDI65362.1 hypothetical protein SAMN04487926_12158 [Paraburkholderia steynii]